MSAPATSHGAGGPHEPVGRSSHPQRSPSLLTTVSSWRRKKSDPIFLGLCAQIKIFRSLAQFLHNVACHFCFIMRTRPPGRGLNDLHAASNEYECEMLLWIRQTTDTTVLVCWTPGARRIPPHPPVVSLLFFDVSQTRQKNNANAF